jgi:DNA-binding NarL/FixJ family response regulator
MDQHCPIPGGTPDMNDERPRKTRALAVDDHEGIFFAIQDQVSKSGFDVLDTETSRGAALARLKADPDYDLVFLDLHLADATDLEAVIAVREEFPELSIIVYSGETRVDKQVRAYEYCQGFVCKSWHLSQLRDAISVVRAGGIYIPPQLAKSLGFSPPPTAPSNGGDNGNFPALSPRQREVMQQLLLGLPNKVIARRLNMADGTVKSHLNTVYRMFGVNSRAQLILKARELHLI